MLLQLLASVKLLMITHKLRFRESGLLDECAQHDSQGFCHPERSEGSVADLWVITSKTIIALPFTVLSSPLQDVTLTN